MHELPQVIRSRLACCLFAGCTFTPPAPFGGGGDDPDCHGTAAVSRVCLASQPTSPLILTGPIDTGAGACLPTTQGTAVGSCVLAGTQVAIGAITVVGPRPLIIVATAGDLEITGDIDASSRLGVQIGPGAAIGPCDPGMPPSSRGGGQGGSFGFGGGNGGNSQAGIGGVAGAPIALGDTLRGGCAGAAGHGAGAGAGGPGGGAIALVSDTRILVAANINASGAAGAAGEPGPDGGGGAGGGGSGGAIVLDTPDLELSGRLFANGGGAGGAGDNDTAGTRGGEPTPTARGAGGAGVDEGGRGGDGSAGGGGAPGSPGRNDRAAGGGGGGGGGAGVILITDETPPERDVSPPAR